MKSSHTSLLLTVLLAFYAARAAEFALLVTGEVKSELKLTLPELKAVTNCTVTVSERDGNSAKIRRSPSARHSEPRGCSVGRIASGRCAVVVRIGQSRRRV
jgi:hypothetical protein